MKSILLAATALIAAAACAPTASQAAAAGDPPAGSDCFRNRDINTYRLLDEHTLRVVVGHDRAYDLTTTEGRLRDADTGLHLALRSDASWICTGNGLDTEIVSPREPGRAWHVETIVRVPEDILHPPPQGEPQK